MSRMSQAAGVSLLPGLQNQLLPGMAPCSILPRLAICTTVPKKSRSLSAPCSVTYSAASKGRQCCSLQMTTLSAQSVDVGRTRGESVQPHKPPSNTVADTPRSRSAAWTAELKLRPYWQYTTTSRSPRLFLCPFVDLRGVMTLSCRHCPRIGLGVFRAPYV